MSISVAIPTHFCPSFFPCIKLTSALVPIKSVRISRDGLFHEYFGVQKYFFIWIKCRAANMSRSARTKPMTGDIRSHSITSEALFQCGPTPIPYEV